MSIEDIIANGVVEAVEALYGLKTEAGTVQIQQTRKEFEGNLTVVVFHYLKASHKSPDATAAEIGEWLKANVEAVAGYNAVKGFLNLSVSPRFWLSQLHSIAEDADFGIRPVTDSSELVMVEYSSPNTNKPLHLGHVRNNLLGYSLSRILEANGKRVVKTNIVNDRGIHICKSMLAWQKWGNGATPESSGKKGDHLIGDFYVEFDKHFKQEVNELMAQGMSKEEAEAKSPLMLEAREMLRRWEANDPEVRQLWKMMNGWVYDG
ncbi:MAG: arginine--tRNA ligase, partial [Muribaculaceae bacterium]|nr:arginine--tRNA ligase [Muribaculaceae bacterium]